ncbi:hypothetical protein PspCFBP13528_14775 [Pseudomonas sp. CFBP13528]|nr:hypothetical protein PspCFBP13528_14775 [Pseudomonas sp. CFBP13528]
MLVVGASLPAKNSQAPRSFRKHAVSLTFFASKLAPTFGLCFDPGQCVSVTLPYTSRLPL